MNKKSFTEIDLARLEEECLRQPKLYNKYSKMLADAKLDLAEAKAECEVAEASVKTEIRESPTKHGITKITESVVNEHMVMSEHYQHALQRMNQAKHKVDVLDAVINTLEHRKRMLENLVTLFGQNYFSKPSVKGSKYSDKARESDLMESFTRKRKKGN